HRQLLSTLARAVTSTRGLATFLEGPSRYLVLAANNAEMRAGSGTVLSAGVLTARDGRLSLGEFQPTGDLRLPGDGVALPKDLRARWGWLHPGREWRNLAASPRFDVTGEVATRMWRAAGGKPVEGVLVVDVEALASVLRAVGPVDVGGERIDADGAVR